jgi:hypothetical protein
LRKGLRLDAEEEKENKRIFKKNPLSWTRLSEPGQLDQNYGNKS